MEKVYGTSYTLNPVTQTALVDVNNAFKKVMEWFVAFGNISKKAPIKIKATKLIINNWGGLIYLRLNEKLGVANSLINFNNTANCKYLLT